MFAAAAFRCSHLCLWLLFWVGVKKMQIHIWKSKIGGRSSLLQGPKRIRSYAHRCLVKHVYLNLCGIINGIEEIAGGFTSKVDFRSLLKIMFNLSMLQKASKRRSPNPFNPPTPWGHEACRWSLKPKPLPPLVSSHYPKLILRGEVYLSPPPLHWVVAPAFNICSDYSRSRNLMLSPRARLQILTFFIFQFWCFLGPFFGPRRNLL